VAQLAHRTSIPASRLSELERYAPPREEEVRALAAALGLRAAPLAALARQAVAVPEVALRAGPWTVERLTSPRYGSHCYLVGPDEGGKALAVDPGDEASALVARLRERGWRLGAILVTHAHHDHLGAVLALWEATGAAVWGPAEVVAEVELPGEVVRRAQGTLPLEPGPVEALPTPGHTEGHTAFRLADAVFCGDALFAASAGRPRSPAGYAELLRSLAVLAQLDPATRLFPGHGPATTVGAERKANPFFPDVDEL
jgi:hydroxyacylglutathione hydrolase